MDAVGVYDDGLYRRLGLDDTTRRFVEYRTREIRVLARRAARDIVVIGQRLLEVKEVLPYGAFGPWLLAEFNWTDRTAQNFMRVAKRFKSETVSDLNIGTKALYLLASDNTPDVVVDEALDLAGRAHTPLSEAQVRELIDRHNGTERNDLAETRGRNADPIFEGLEDITAAALSIRRALEMAARGVDDPDAARLLLDAHKDAELIRATAINVRTLAGGAPYRPRQ